MRQNPSTEPVRLCAATPARRRAKGRVAGLATSLGFEALEERRLLSAGDRALTAPLFNSHAFSNSSISPIDVQAALGKLTTSGAHDNVFQLQGEQLSAAGLLEPQTDASSTLINLDSFRQDARFAGIDGRGFSIVLIDTGIDLDHPFFGPDADGNGVADRIVFSYDFFGTNDPDASDTIGHGSNVASIAASSDTTYPGMAPAANIISLKVFADGGGGASSDDLEEALQWVVANASVYNVAAVNLSLGTGNFQTAYTSSLSDELEALADLNVIVSAAAGNGYFTYGSQMGVAFPAADPNTIAVGAVFDSDFGPHTYSSGAIANSSAPDVIAPFSQRHSTLMHVMAPGAPITGANHQGGLITYHGTSQAAPHVGGVAVLMQQLAVQTLGRRITLAEMRTALASSSLLVHDGDDENDNVTHTNLDFPRLDVLALAEAVRNLAPGSVTGSVYHDANADGVRNANEAGLGGWTVFVDTNGNGTAEPSGASTVAAADVPRSIPDRGSITSALTVAGMLGPIADVDVTLSISHAFDADLDVFLVAPDGTRVELFTDVGGNGDGFLGTTLDGQAATLINSGSAPFSGSFRPEGKLTSLNGGNPNGQWRLEVADDESSDTGTLQQWSLSIHTMGETIVQSANDGSYTIDGLAPGSYAVRELVSAGWTQSSPAGGSYTAVVGPNQTLLGRDFGNRTGVVSVPGLPDLLPFSDTGVNSSDNRTSRDNSSQAKALLMLVPGTIPGATVTVYSANTPIGSAVAAGPNTVVPTSGQFDLIDGGHWITARQSVPGLPASGASPPLILTIDTRAPTVDIIDVTPDPRLTGVEQVVIRFTEPVVGFELGDLHMQRDTRDVPLGGLQLAAVTDSTTWTLSNLSGLTRTAGQYMLSLADSGLGVSDLAGNALSSGTSDQFQVSATIALRRVFYNNSWWDGNDGAAGPADDAAIATDKSALLPGGTATLANYTSYSRGINGVMIDVAGLAGVPTASDFDFRVGNQSDTRFWSAPSTAPAISLRLGAGTGGSDRITLTWPDLAIARQWLQVTMLATPRTGLAASDVFYFGNAIAEAGNSATNTLVDSADLLAARLNPRTVANPAPIDFLYDYNRDRMVNVADQLIARGNPTTIASSLSLIAPLAAASPLGPAPALAALAGAGDWLDLLAEDNPLGRRKLVR